MAKKKSEYETPEVVLEKFYVKNLKESTFPVQIINDEGQIEHLTIRIQGRMGQKPPIISSTQVTDHIRDLVKKGFIKLVKVEA